MHVKIARKKTQGTGREKGNYVWYSCVPIIRRYALPVIRFIRMKFANFVPRKTRTFRIPFDTHKFDVSARAYFPMPHSRLFLACTRRRFHARIIITNSLSPIVIVGTSKRLDKNDFSLRSTVSHLRIFLAEVVIIDPMAFYDSLYIDLYANPYSPSINYSALDL